MNYLVVLDPTHGPAILRTEKASDRRDIYPTLPMARAELRLRVDQAIEKLRQQRDEACSMREKGLQEGPTAPSEQAKDAAE